MGNPARLAAEAKHRNALRPALMLVLYFLMSASFTAIGAIKLWHVETGTATTATVTSCAHYSGLHGGYDICTGMWVVGGPLTAGGQFVIGTVDGASSRDIGKTVPVRVSGGTAYVRSLTTPVFLISFGVGLLVLILVARLISRRGTATGRGATYQPQARMRFLADLVRTLPGVRTVDDLRAAVRPRPTTGIAVEPIVSFPPTPGVRMVLRPPTPAKDIASLLGMSRPKAFAVDVHQHSWRLGDAREDWNGNPHAGFTSPRIGRCRIDAGLQKHPVLAPDLLIDRIEVILDDSPSDR